MVVADRRQSVWSLVALLVVDVLVFAFFLSETRDTSYPPWSRIVTGFVAALAMFLAGLTIVRLVRRARQDTTIGA